MANIEFLHRRVGQRIVAAFAEIDSEGGLVAVWLHFADGNPIVLGCAGDGGIFARKAKPWQANAAKGFETTLQPLTQLHEGALEAVEPGNEQLTLRTSERSLIVFNDCDELAMELRGDGRRTA